MGVLGDNDHDGHGDSEGDGPDDGGGVVSFQGSGEFGGLSN